MPIAKLVGQPTCGRPGERYSYPTVRRGRSSRMIRIGRMSARTADQQPDAELQQVIPPRIPRPSVHEVEAAKRDIPEALTEDGRDFASSGVSAPMLGQWLCEGWGHSRNAAEWAIADCIRDDCLRPAKIKPLPNDWQSQRHFQVFPTRKLWDWWATLRTPDDGGKPFAPCECGGAAQRNERQIKLARKRRYDPKRDQEVFDGWRRAKDSGVQKKQFASDQKLTVRELNRLLNRHAKRQARD